MNEDPAPVGDFVLDEAGQGPVVLVSGGAGITAVLAMLEAVEAGDVDFGAMVEETRRKMQASFEKGQHLGNARKAAKPKAKRPTRK